MNKKYLPLFAVNFCLLFAVMTACGDDKVCRGFDGNIEPCEVVNAESCNACVGDEGLYYSGGMCVDECIADASCYGENASECPAENADE